MAKARKTYYKKRPVWHWIIFYILIGGVIFSLIYYSGLFGLNEFKNNSNQEQEVEYYQ